VLQPDDVEVRGKPTPINLQVANSLSLFQLDHVDLMSSFTFCFFAGLLDGVLCRRRWQVLPFHPFLLPHSDVLHRVWNDGLVAHPRGAPGQHPVLLLLRAVESPLRLPHPQALNPSVLALVLVYRPSVSKT